MLRRILWLVFIFCLQAQSQYIYEANQPLYHLQNNANDFQGELAYEIADDGISPVIDFSFNFNFYGNTFDSARIATNGCLHFGLTSTAYADYCGDYTPDPLPRYKNTLYPFWTDLRDSTSKAGAYSFNDDQYGGDSSGWSRDLSTPGTRRWVNGNNYYNGSGQYFPSFDDDAFLEYFSGPSSIDSNGNQVYWSPAQYAGQGLENPILTGGLEYSGGNSNSVSDWAVNDDSDWDTGYNLATVRKNQNYVGIHNDEGNMSGFEGPGFNVEDGGNWKRGKDWDTSSVNNQYGASQTGHFYMWNPLARFHTSNYGQPSSSRHEQSSYYCGTSSGDKDGYARIRFNFNYESLEQEFEPGASIVLTMNFKSCVWLEDDGGPTGTYNKDRYELNELGDFNKTWIIRCPESLDSIYEQMKYVTHVLSDWGDVGGPGTSNDSMASESQPVYRDATGNAGVGLPFWNEYSDDAKNNSSFKSVWTWTNRPMALQYSKILTMELAADNKNNFEDMNLQGNPSDNGGTRLTTDKRGISLAFNVDADIVDGMGEPGDGHLISNKAATMKQVTNQVTLEYKKSTAFMLEGLADNVTQTFKTGAYHDFGVIYYDLEGRCSTVTIDANNSTYVKFVPEDKTEEEIVENGGIGNGPVSMEWEINHRAPTWARFFRWAYGRNSSVDDFIQFLGRKPFCAPSSSEDTRIYLSFNSFRGNEESYVEIDDPLIQYQFVKGDRIRFLYKSQGGGYVVFNSYIDLKLSGMNYYDINMTPDECPFVADLDPNGADDGFYLEFHEVSDGVEAAVMSKAAVLSDTHIYKDVMFEVYRPKKSVDPDKTIYYEYGPLYRIIPNLHLHTGDIQNQGPANLIDNNGNYYSATGAKGKFTLGDVWYKPRIMKAADDGTTVVNFVEDYFLNDFLNSLSSASMITRP